jgi:YfiH family protein
MRLKYKNDLPVLRENQEGELLYLTYEQLEKTNIVKHAFSTRLGGCSEGIYASMNLSFAQGDKEEAVRENYRRMAKVLGVHSENIVKPKQTHTVNVARVTKENKADAFEDTDGLVTNVPGICLATTYADCVPLYFVDPVRKAIGLSHSGWRGTVGKMGRVTLEKMKVEFGTEAKDVIAAIGPSICQDCYEVSKDVIEQFQKVFDASDWDSLFYEKENQKFQLNLWRANEILLLEAGVLKENIAVTNVCTNCNPDVLFSHRASKGKRGALAAFLCLKEMEE